MREPRRWSLLLWACAVCIIAACTRPAARRRASGGGVIEPPAPPQPSASATLSASVDPAAASGIPESSDSAPAASTTLGPQSPTPAYPGVYSGTPTPHPTPTGQAVGKGTETYVIRPGEVLGSIADRYNCTVEEIVRFNGLPNADSIRAGQTIIVPVAASRTGLPLKLIPDSELVYGPAYIHFDLDGFVAQRGGYLASYSERVEGEELTGVEIIRLISQRFSVGPRVLLTLLDLQSGWVSQVSPAYETLYYPLGYVQAYQEGLFRQLTWAAMRLNEGYYGWNRGQRQVVRFADGSRYGIAPEVNAGTAAVQNCLAEMSSTSDEWLGISGPTGFLATYQRLFGNPFAYSVEPLVPPDLTQPELRLPWEAGHTWYLTGGPHGAWGEANDYAAMDFVSNDEYLGCTPSTEWLTAVGSGRVVRSENGEVLLDLDGDGFEQSGWVIFYLHVHSEGRVEAGTYLRRGERVGHPSCEGGYSEATHLHLARRYNGQWMPAGSGPLPMVLSGWSALEGEGAYDGSMVRGAQTRTSCECWEDAYNGLLSDNVP